jgi:clan AA aspartic protease
MIEGDILANGSPVIQLRVLGSRHEAIVACIIDTGFTGFLCLPISLAVTLGLELIETTSTELADGTLVENELVFAGQAEWDGMIMDVSILLTRSEEALIGTAFLEGYLVHLDYQARTVRIEKASE